MATGHFDERDYLRIHRELAEKHVSLKHDDDRNCAFLSWRKSAKESINNAAGSGRVNEYVMMMEVPRGTLIDAGVDFVRDNVIGGFAIVAIIPSDKSKDIEYIHDRSSEAKRIAIDILIRLKKMALHTTTGLPCEDMLQGFDLNNVVYEEVEDLSISAIGHMFTYPLKCATPIKYDAERWL